MTPDVSVNFVQRKRGTSGPMCVVDKVDSPSDIWACCEEMLSRYGIPIQGFQEIRIVFRKGYHESKRTGDV